MTEVEKKAARFATLGREMRLQMLLGYAKRFPELPEELVEARDRGMGRVDECQTPLFLWIRVDEAGAVTIHADAPREAPTVRGFVGFLMDALNGRPAAEVRALPLDLLERMGLAEVLGVMRTQGLGAVLRRVRGAVSDSVATRTHPPA